MMDLQHQHLTCCQDQGVVVLTPVEPELHNDVLDPLREELAAAVAGLDTPRVVLDFRGVRYLSSAGLRALLQFRRQLRLRGGQLLLCGLDPAVADVFFTTRLANTTASATIPFGLAPDVPTAVANLVKAISQK